MGDGPDYQLGQADGGVRKITQNILLGHEVLCKRTHGEELLQNQL